MNVQPIDLGDELWESVQPLLALGPVVVRPPVARELLNRRDGHALRIVATVSRSGHRVAITRLRNSLSSASGKLTSNGRTAVGSPPGCCLTSSCGWRSCSLPVLLSFPGVGEGKRGPTGNASGTGDLSVRRKAPEIGRALLAGCVSVATDETAREAGGRWRLQEPAREIRAEATDNGTAPTLLLLGGLAGPPTAPAAKILAKSALYARRATCAIPWCLGA